MNLFSIFLAKSFCLYFIITTVALFINKDYFMKMSDKLMKNNELIMMWGAITLILGIVLIQLHNIWLPKWTLIITLLAWITFLKGACLLLFPKQASSVMKKIYNKNTILVSAGITFLIGLFLGYMGFFVY